MNKKSLLLASLVGIAIAIAAIWFFKPDPSILGKWDIVGDGLAASVNPVIEFRVDGTFLIVSSGLSGDVQEIPEGQEEFNYENMVVGTWEIKGDQLDMMYNDQGLKINGELVEITTQAEGIDRQRILNNLNSFPPYDFKWIGPDEFETHSKGLTRRYKRVDKE